MHSGLRLLPAVAAAGEWSCLVSLSKEGNVKKFAMLLVFLSFFAASVLPGQDRAGHASDMDHVVVRPDDVTSSFGCGVGSESTAGTARGLSTTVPSGAKKRCA